MALNEQMARRIRALEAQMRQHDVYERHIPYCDLRSSVNLTIPTGANTILLFDTEANDVGGLHSTIANTGRITIVVAGFYLFTAGVSWEAGAVGIRDLRIYKNTSIVAIHRHTPIGGQTADNITISRQIHMDVGDYATANVWQTSGGDLDVVKAATGGHYSPIFCGCLLG